MIELWSSTICSDTQESAFLIQDYPWAKNRGSASGKSGRGSDTIIAYPKIYRDKEGLSYRILQSHGSVNAQALSVFTTGSTNLTRRPLGESRTHHAPSP